MKIRVTGMSVSWIRHEYHKCLDEVILKVPKKLEKASDEEIVKALKDKISNASFDFVRDDEYQEGVSYEIERID